ncbi:MAG: hypothetical protein NT062_13000, partial [Proteobacteria bacterium]|nr:hypothetical protein [Pseudomonadota bacterium]
PELALLQMPLAQLTTILGSDTAHLADAGFSTTKGFAFFQTEDQLMFAILPMGDRDKLVKTLHGQRGGASPPADVDVINSMACKVVQGVYACTQAKDLAALDRLGKGKGQLDARFARLGARGDVEVFVDKAALGASGLDDLVAAATLDHGQLAIDVLGGGKPPALATLVAVDKPKADVTNAAGFIVANLTPMLGALPPIEIAGVALPTLARTVKGPLIAMFTVGALEFSLRVPLTDPAPMTALLGKCDELVPEPMRAKQPTPGACSLVIPNAVPVPADLWVEGNELRVATKKTPKARPAVDVLTPMGRELAAGGWDYAVWGRGSIVAPDGMPFPAMPQNIPQQALLAVRMYAQLSEFGMGVKIDDADVRVHLLARTIWANPADVAEKLSAITADEIFKNSAAPKVSAIAAAAPTSPYAADLRAGQAGLMAPLVVVGMASAVAIPAFLDYTRKAKKSEAEIQLNRLGKYARIAYDTNAAFPVGEAQTPMASCCEFPTRRCAPDPAV